MKNNLILGGVILAVLVLVVVILGLNPSHPALVENSNSATTETQKAVTSTKTTKTKSSAPVSGMKTSLGGIFDEKGSYACEYESVNSQTRSSNVIYISDGKMRGEFRTIEAGASKSSILVYDGSSLYLWTEGQAVGKVSQPKTLKDLPGIIPEDVSSGRVLGSGLSSVSWICHPWSKIPSFLVKPAYVTFY